MGDAKVKDLKHWLQIIRRIAVLVTHKLRHLLLVVIRRLSGVACLILTIKGQKETVTKEIKCNNLHFSAKCHEI